MAETQKIIHVSALGNLGNRMIQFMAALALSARVPGARFSKVELAEWGITHAVLGTDAARTEIVTAPVLDMERLAACLNDGALDAVDLRTYAQNMANFLPATAYMDVFPRMEGEGAGPNELLCNIRQGDVLNGHHPDYVLIPPDFYAELINATGLSPVFMGQIEDSPYIETLRQRFPRARFVPGRNPIADFQFIRNSRNIVLSVSTFSWLAAYLSGAQRIFMPVLGLFHPWQCRSVNLLPLDDPRFDFTLFPFHYAAPVAEVAGAHASLTGLWRAMPAGRLRRMFASPAPVPSRDPGMRAELLLEDRYLQENPDVAQAVASGGFPSGLHHFLHHGVHEGRPAPMIDSAWYCRTYPMAAFELGQGDAPDALQHWLDIGRHRGYRRSG